MTTKVKTSVSAGSAVGAGENATAVKVVSSLSKKMAEPGGLTIEAIERRAQERLQSHKVEALRAVERAVCDLEERTGANLREGDEELYRIASQMLDVAGFFDTGPLYDAGYSLCELLDVLQTQGQWNSDAINVHVSALRLILKEDCKLTPGTAAMLQGLRAVLDHARKS